MNGRLSVAFDWDALTHNVTQVSQRCPGAKILAMVKGNAYGHGLVACAQVLAPQVAALGVATFEEALLLRQAGISSEIVVMTGFLNRDELTLAQSYALSVVIHNKQQVDALSALSKPFQANVWVKCHVGMNRLGLGALDVAEVVGVLTKLGVSVRLMAHLSHSAEADGDEVTQRQQANFQVLAQAFEGEKSLASSAGILSARVPAYDWVRPGIMLYGACPLAGKDAASFQLKPVMTVKARVIALNVCEAGETIGYGGRYVCPARMRVGVVSVGYADGYPRSAEDGTPVLIHGVICPLVGRVSMDMITVHIPDDLAVSVGDAVTLWGEGLPVERVAFACKTIPYELFTRVNGRSVATETS
jgi:alanine racemase